MWKPHFKIVWLNKNRKKKKHGADRIHLPDRCLDQNRRPLAYDLCSAPSGSAGLCDHSSCSSFPCLPHSPQWLPFRFSKFWALPYSESFVVVVFCAYSCFGSFSFKPPLSFHFLRVAFSDPLPKITTSPFTLLFSSFILVGLKVWSREQLKAPETLSEKSMRSKLVLLQ